MRSNASRDLAWARLRGAAQRAACLEPDQERELLARAGSEPRALAILVESHMRLVLRIAQSYAYTGVCAEDLAGEGMLGLLEAIRRFDSSVDTRLSSYAKWWIRARVRAYALANRRLVPLPSTRAARLALSRGGGLERELAQKLGRPPRRDELAEALAIPLEDLNALLLALRVRDLPIASDEEGSLANDPETPFNPEHALAEAERRAQLHAAIRETWADLTARQRRVFAAQLADDDDATFRDLGVELGVSRQRVSQIAASIRERLRVHLA